MKSALLLAFISLAFSLLPAQRITLHPCEWVVPSENLPADLALQDANNNLDVIAHNGRYWMAFRTAPTHFASAKTVLHLLSSDDLKSWKKETSIHIGADLREPRFLVFNGQLHFYFFEAGTHPLKFEPRKLWTMTLGENGKWSEATQVPGLDGYVPWRIRTRGDTAYLSAYYGVGLYAAGKVEGNLRLFQSTDGLHWQPLTEAPQCEIPHAEEGEFVFDEEGNLWATVRLESEGGVVISAKKDALGTWKQRRTPFKYDSAYMFTHKNEVYLVSRRNVDGTMGKAPEWFPFGLRKSLNLARYSVTRKRSAIWKLDKEGLEWQHLTDIPGTGDTAFPAVVPLGGNDFVIFNYTSDFTERDPSWIGGQIRPTRIYQMRVTIE